MFANLDRLSHHAYIIEGNRNDIIPKLFLYLEQKHGVSTRGNPDFWHTDFDTFGIDDARALKEMQARKGAGSQNKFFVFSAVMIMEEAQNALLKICEEPTEGTHFFIIVPSVARVVPTLLSRAIVMKAHDMTESYDISYEKMIEQFLDSSPQKRLALVKNLIEEKNKEQAILFLNAIEKKLAEEVGASDTNTRAVARLKKTARARDDLMINAPSIKLIFEYLALTL